MDNLRISKTKIYNTQTGIMYEKDGNGFLMITTVSNTANFTALADDEGGDVLWDYLCDNSTMLSSAQKTAPISAVEQANSAFTTLLHGYFIKGCPFCAEPQSITVALCESGEQRVQCNNCGGVGPNERNTARAIEMWNMRRAVKPGQ